MASLNNISASNDQTIGTVQIDARINEQHQSDITISEFPLEDGVIATDHRIIKPKILIIDGIVSNVKKTIEDITGHAGNSDVSTYEQLLELQESGVPFSIVTDLVVYNNMLIKDITAKKNQQTANVLMFTATLQSVLVINTQTIKLPKKKIAEPNKERGSSTEDQGTKVPDNQNKVTHPDNVSYLEKIRRWF